MKEAIGGKLLGTWCLFMLALPLAVVWIRPDFEAGRSIPALIKLAIIFTSLSAAATILVYMVMRQWATPTRRLNEFIAALPAQEKNLPTEGPPEIQDLSRSMKAMAERVRSIVEQTNLESSRRETILACMAEGVLAVDNSLRVIFCNQAFASAFSIRMPVAEGRSLYEVVREPLLRDILERVLRSGSNESDRFQLPSAAGRWFEARALPFGLNDTRGAVIVLHDITDIQRQEQMRKDFVADVSHEFRTPLAAIRGYAETLLDGALEDEEHNRKFLEIILSHSIRLNNIASDLLVLSELDTESGSPVVPERISVLETIKSAVNTVAPAAESRGVLLDYGRCEDVAVSGVRFRLEQAFINLLDNAVKFNRPGGEVRIECRDESDGRVIISVSDTGIGIPRAEISRIFERFYRVDKARSRPAGGTGLGLPIVKEVVERMGGTISVDSYLGSGSKFTVTLPRA
jgi:two-component system, OmpR family, phosphate regulon sensor histidine kinase PhoR